MPTLMIHGTVEALVRPEGGQDAAASIQGAGMRMPPQITEAIVENTRRAG